MSQASVLIVEDEAIVAADLASKLERMGYRVVGSTDTGEEAIRLAAQQRPSLILMDIRLAGEMDGIEAAAVIRREWNLPVVFLTAHSEPITLERVGETGAFGYVLKPFREPELYTQIAMALYKDAAERRIRESEERLRLAAGATGFGTYDVYPLQGRSVWSPELYAITGVPETTTQKPPFMNGLVHPDDREALRGLVQRVLDPAGPSGYELEYRIVRPDGGTRWVRDTGRAVSEGEADTRRAARVIGTVQDITEQKRTELELHRLNELLEGQVAERTRSLRHATGELLLAEARERRELAIEMHDSLGQELALARMKLDELARALDRGDTNQARDDARKAAALIEQADRSSRVLIHHLSPHALYEAGLAVAVRTLAEEFHRMHGLQVDCSGVDDRVAVPDKQTREILYRAIRELFFNVIKHAGANQVSVSITRHDDQIGVTVCDAGAGFDPAAAGEGRGLPNTRERIEHLTGTMEVESAPGKGTKVIIGVPL